MKRKVFKSRVPSHSSSVGDSLSDLTMVLLLLRDKDRMEEKVMETNRVMEIPAIID